MSSTDPIQARLTRESRRLGSPAALSGVVIGLVLITVGAALLARALFGFAEFDAQTSQNPTGDVAEPPLAIAGMILSLPLVILGFFVHSFASRRFTGRLLSAPGIGPGTVLFVGLAAGSWWGAFALVEPGPWLPLPAGLSILAALLFLIGAVVRVRRRRHQDLLGHLFAHGLIVTGEIVEIPEIDPTSGGLIGPVTVKFTDTSGTDRWVQKIGQWPRRDLPATGDAASVLYDPANPSDTSRIWLAPPGSTTAADFTRWRA